MKIDKETKFDIGEQVYLEYEVEAHENLSRLQRKISDKPPVTKRIRSIALEICHADWQIFYGMVGFTQTGQTTLRYPDFELLSKSEGNERIYKAQKET